MHFGFCNSKGQSARVFENLVPQAHRCTSPDCRKLRKIAWQMFRHKLMPSSSERLLLNAFQMHPSSSWTVGKWNCLDVPSAAMPRWSRFLRGSTRSTPTTLGSLLREQKWQRHSCTLRFVTQATILKASSSSAQTHIRRHTHTQTHTHTHTAMIITA